jgi:uncharacterized protein (DUF433 family)
MDYQGRITIDPEVRFGKPCARQAVVILLSPVRRLARQSEMVG